MVDPKDCIVTNNESLIWNKFHQFFFNKILCFLVIFRERVSIGGRAEGVSDSKIGVKE